MDAIFANGTHPYFIAFYRILSKQCKWGLSFNVFNLSRSGAIPCLLPHPTRRFISFLRLARASSPGFRVVFLPPSRSSLSRTPFGNRLRFQTMRLPPVAAPSTSPPAALHSPCECQRRCTRSPSPSFWP